MNRRLLPRCRPSLLAFLLIAVAFPGRAESSSVTSSIVDLSHLHHLPPASLKRAVEDHASGRDSVILNLSHASLGDGGVKEILMDMIRQGELSSAQIDLSMNRLTPVGVSLLFDAILKEQSRDSAINDSVSKESSHLPVSSLDLSYNYLAADLAKTTKLHSNLELLVSNHEACPTNLCFDQCSIGPAFCRALGKGLIHRYINEETETPIEADHVPPLCLSLSGNPEIGDAGTAALAAALRSIATLEQSLGSRKNVLQKLNLSSCAVGNLGAEALALALEDGCGAQFLDLSNNNLQDEGVAAIGRAIAMADGLIVRVLDLSNNEVGVAGCTALLVAMGKGHLREVRLRSCHIHADATEIIGKGIRSIILQDTIPQVDIDLSGNPLGVLRGKNKKDAGKYSASRIKSTATATATSYINLFKKSLKDVGMDAVLGVASAESDDDDDDEKLPGEDNSDEDEDSEFAKKRCGAKSMANAFLKEYKEDSRPLSIPCRIRLGLRHCFFDHEAADAIAAMIVEAKDRFGADLTVDVSMNPVLEDEMVNALHGDDPDDDRRREMAERHLDVLMALKEAQERATEARAMARVRKRSQGASSWKDEGAFGDLFDGTDSTPDYVDDMGGYDSADDSE